MSVRLEAVILYSYTSVLLCLTLLYTPLKVYTASFDRRRVLRKVQEERLKIWIVDCQPVTAPTLPLPTSELFSH